MSPHPPSPGTRRWLPWLFVVFALVHAAINVVRPMVSYRALDMGVPPQGLGLLSAAFAIAPLIVAMAIGRRVDRQGEIRFVLVGIAVIAGGTVAISAAPVVGILAVAYSLVGLGHLATVVATQSLVARGIATSGYDRAFGHMTFSASLGQLLGPALAAWVVGQGTPDDVTRTILVAAVLTVAALPFCFAIRARVPSPERTGQSTSQQMPLYAILRMPGIARAILVSLTVLSAVDIVIVYLPALGTERGWTASVVGLLLAVRGGASMASRLFLGRLSARFGRRALLVWSMAIAAISLVALPLASTPELTAVVMFAAGMGLGIGQPLTMSWVAAEARPGTRATALSVRVMGNRVGQIVLPVAAGSVAAFAGVGGVLAVTGCAIAISLALVSGGLGSRRDADSGDSAGPNREPSPHSR